MKKSFITVLMLFSVLSVFSCGGDNNTVVLSNNNSTISNAHTVDKKKYTFPDISDMPEDSYRKGEILVKFKDGVASSNYLSAHKKIRAYTIRRFSIVKNLERVKLPVDISIKEALYTYMSNPDIEYVEPNYIRKASLEPDDPLFPLQWGLDKLEAQNAWDISTGSSSIIVAVVDSGINYDHPDLTSNIWLNPDDPVDGIDNDGNGYVDDIRGWDFVGMDVFNPTPDNDPDDEHGHGTHVSGTIGAIGNNSIVISGVNWTISLIALKFLDASGFGTTADEIAALEYAIDKGAKIINASFGGTSASQAEMEAINNARAHNIILVAASGNGGDDGIGDNNDITPEYPASYDFDNIISVTASNQNDNKASFANYGLLSVDVAAPGVGICSTVPAFISSSGYGCTYSGTSMATPHVSGVAALLWSYYSHFSYSQIKATLEQFVDTVSSFSGITKTGGRVNAYESLSSLLIPTGLTTSLSGFGVDASATGSIILSWTDNARHEEGYIIERKPSGGSYAEMGTVPTNSETYTDSTAVDGTAYSYRVKTYNSIGSSSYPDEISVTTTVSAPTGLNATTVSTSQIGLSWTDNSSSEEGYRIERKVEGGTFEEIVTVASDISTYSDTGLIEATRYIYRVRAFNTESGNSDYSNEASATTLSSVRGSGGGGGGGCSLIQYRTTVETSIADVILFLIPLFIFIIKGLRTKP